MANHAELMEQLRASGHRLTPQRESVLTVLAESDTHLTAEEVIQRVRRRYPYLNNSAVYRSLDLLTGLGLVNQTDLGQGRVEYELHVHPHHHHLVCRSCGSITRVEHACFKPLERQLRERYGFEADLDHFAIFGRCGKCQRESE